MPRAYQQRLRAAKSAQTRARILAAARDSIKDSPDLQVDDIAARAGVSLPTLYSHFGSKGGLLSALVGEIEHEAGLFAGFEEVWQCPDGEAALRMMLETTLRFWQHAWTFIKFSMRARRNDPDLESRYARIDASRLGHLVVICRRLAEEGRLKAGLTPATAARLAFAMSTPYVYEAMVIEGHLAATTARQMVAEAAVAALLRAGTNPVRQPRANWPKLGLKPPVTG